MALCGNHGIIIPRDAALLRALYWDKNHSLPEIGAMFGVSHKSIERVMRELGIPRRKVGNSRNVKCIECGAPIVKIKHAKNGSFYGRRCRTHQRTHKAKIMRERGQRPEVKQLVARQNQLNYYVGPRHIKGEKQWISQSRVLLRHAKRMLAAKQNPEASVFLSEALQQVLTSRS
jgi:hypothetical protein